MHITCALLISTLVTKHPQQQIEQWRKVAISMMLFCFVFFSISRLLRNSASVGWAGCQPKALTRKA